MEEQVKKEKVLEPYQEIERALIKKFRKPIWRKFTQAINDYDLIQEGDKIAVCISGGKDSMLLAKLMQELQRHGKFPFELVFLVMDPGYNPRNRKKIEDNAKLLNIPITVFESPIFNSVVEIEDNPCYLCARMRRGYLYKNAQDLGCNKIALGHHFDDVVETILMGMLYGAQIQTRYRDEIGDLADTINEMSTKISQNEKMQAEFISQLSHELRTPLTVINGWSETLLADESMDADTRQGMKIISSEAKRLTEMVMELLDFTRMQDGRMTLTVEPTDIRTEFEDTVYMYSSRLSQDGIRLDYIDNDEDIPEISCDPKRLRQVFLNILDNAAKHGGEGKRIEASMSCEDDSVVVRIRDFGPGIPEDEIPLVKKKFYKGSSQARGTGIGLAVCDEIVEMHGGTLTLENAQGGGTLVTVRLPAV